MRLRPVAEADLTIIERLTMDEAGTGEFGWYGFFDPQMWRRKWADNQLTGDDGGVLIVTNGSEPIGLVNWRRKKATPPSWYLEMGIALLPEFRGKGHGTRAHQALARYLFAHTMVHRIEAATETGNIAEQKALEKAGFTREGVLRGIGWRDGGWRDGVLYSLLRTDPGA